MEYKLETEHVVSPKLIQKKEKRNNMRNMRNQVHGKRARYIFFPLISLVL